MERQTYRVRRRRPAAAVFREPSMEPEPYNIPIPSIETSEAPSADSSLRYHLPEAMDGLLKPDQHQPFARFFSPPKTPEAQLISDVERFRQMTPDWARSDVFSRGESISRPSSSGSGLSDSSLESFPSLVGSCTSPESEASDPFSNLPENPKPLLLPSFQGQAARPSESHKPFNFTKEMDDHIWRTYLRVLQDPTATPYKTLPGTVPPSGIQSRVARLAKKTWRGPRSSSSKRIAPLQPAESFFRSDSPDTIKATKSGSSTPTALDVRKPYPSWPGESVTRRRFRMICRSKPSLSAHYQRLMYRSPSPFITSPRATSHPAAPGRRYMSPNLPSDASSSFSTRDMHMSLSTSMASSMQLGNPLSQLASGSDAPQTQNDEWFGQPLARANAHQKSHSLHLELGLGDAPRPRSSGVLGSPFNPRRSRRGIDEQIAQAFGSDATQDDSTRAPKLHAPARLPRSFKRRAQHYLDDEGSHRSEETRKTLLNELFGAPAESSHRRVRSRGFSLGDMGEGARHRLSSLFTPPITIDASNNMFSGIPMLDGVNAPGPASSENTIAPPASPVNRLASPFGGRSTNVHFSNTFPRSFAQHNFEPAASFEERLSQGNASSQHML
jgi:hypothetical protein